MTGVHGFPYGAWRGLGAVRMSMLLLGYHGTLATDPDIYLWEYTSSGYICGNRSHEPQANI